MQSGHYVSSLCRLSVAVTVFVSASASWVWTYTKGKAFNVRECYTCMVVSRVPATKSVGCHGAARAWTEAGICTEPKKEK